MRRQYTVLGATLEAQIDFWQFRNQMTFFIRNVGEGVLKKVIFLGMKV